MKDSTSVKLSAAIVFGAIYLLGTAAQAAEARWLVPPAQKAAKASKVAKASKAFKVARASRPGRGAQRGVASWYGPGFHGRKTASGERFNANAMTAAHRSLPFGTRVKVQNERTGRSVEVRINDRGPFTGGRIIDLSRASAEAIGISGTAPVAVLAL